jgi:outer membrane PBP1 activator LpoA protein
MNYDQISKLMNQISQAKGDERDGLLMLAVLIILAEIIYTLLLAGVVWALGRRMLQAFLGVWRESARLADARQYQQGGGDLS